MFQVTKSASILLSLNVIFFFLNSTDGNGASFVDGNGCFILFKLES